MSAIDPKEHKKKNLRQHGSIKYSKDLSSYQIWLVLNNLLSEAAAPLVAYSNMSVETALTCLSISTDNRRKIAYYKSEEMLTKLFSELSQFVEFDNNKPVTEDQKLELLEYLLNNGVERNIVIDHIAYSLYNLAPHSFLKKEVDFTKLVRHVELYLDLYETFKQDVVFRFYYLISTFSNKNHYVKSLSGLNTNKEEMLHAYVISTIRAIDRFIPYEGTITSYIQTWFQNAQGSSDFIIYDDEAFNLKRGIRKSIQDGDKQINNKVIPIDDKENDVHLVVDESVSTDMSSFPEFSRLIAKLPNSTIVYLAQNLPYILSKEQIERILDNNRKISNGIAGNQKST